jgi:thiF family protein
MSGREEDMGHMPEVRVTDVLINEIGRRLAAFEPERGGALIGFDGVAHILVEDDFGAYGATFWDISREVSDAVGQVEANGYGRFIGTVHTHPSGVCDPSEQDRITMAQALELNPHIEQLMICVVTKGNPRATDVAIPGGHRMSVHVIRRVEGEPECLRARPVVVPIARVLEDAGMPVPGAVTVTDVRAERFDGLVPVLVVDGAEKIVVAVPETDDAWLMGSDILDVPPILMSLHDGRVTAVPVTWGREEVASRMRKMNEERRRVAKPGPESGQEGTPLDRVVELVGSMGERRVLVAGCGSVGSRIAEDLARSGVRHFVLVDPDEVSLPNMARSVYARADVGRAKVAVLAERLRGIAPETEVSTTRRFLREITPEDILDGVDLVVLATDDMTEQAALAKAAYEKRIVQVAAAMYRKAAAGEVMIAVPEARTPCWACAVGTSALSTSERPDTNYGVDGRLVAESGLGASINLVTSVASLLAIGLLAGPGSPAGAGLGRMLAESRVLGLISTTPDWGFFPDVFHDMAHQFQPQSVWPKVESVKGCPVCSKEEVEDVLEGEVMTVEELLRTVEEEVGAAS